MRKAGESPDLVRALYYQGLLTFLNLEDLRELHRLMAEAHAIAERLAPAGPEPTPGMAYCLLGQPWGWTRPKPANECRPR